MRLVQNMAPPLVIVRDIDGERLYCGGSGGPDDKIVVSDTLARAAPIMYAVLQTILVTENLDDTHALARAAIARTKGTP